MDFKFLAHTVRNIILNPVKEWDTIFSENRPAGYFNRYLFLPLLILASVSAFLGSFLFANTELSNAYSVMTGIRYFILFYLAVYGTAFFFREITRAFGPGSDFNISFKIITCSAVPLLLCQILSRLFESFIFVNILSFYGLYILWTGIEKMIDPPEGKKLPLIISATLTFITLFFTANWVLSLVVDKLYFSLFA